MAGRVNVTIGGKLFTCLRLEKADFSDIAAVYAVISVARDGSWSVLDVGQSKELGERIDGHDRKECWQRNCNNGDIWVCIYPMPSSRYSKYDRLQFEEYLRQGNSPPCAKM